MKSKFNKILFAKAIIILPLPFFVFHAFLFMCWHLRTGYLDLVFIFGSICMFVFALRLRKFLEIIDPSSRKRDELGGENTFKYSELAEMGFWYFLTISTYMFLHVQFGFPKSIVREPEWKILALGYGLFFAGAIATPLMLEAISRGYAILKEDFVDAISVIPRISAVFIAYFLVTFVFSLIYRIGYIFDADSFNRPIDGIVEAFYFSTVTICTIGYGDNYPVSTFFKIIVSIEALVGVILLASVLSVSISIALMRGERNNK